MYWLLNSLSAIAGLVSLVCFIMIVIKMFENNRTGLGIACIVLAFCGIGWLVALIVGWQNADRWRIRNVVLAYTISIAAGILLSGAAYALAPKIVVVT